MKIHLSIATILLRVRITGKPWHTKRKDIAFQKTKGFFILIIPLRMSLSIEYCTLNIEHFLETSIVGELKEMFNIQCSIFNVKRKPALDELQGFSFLHFYQLHLL